MNVSRIAVRRSLPAGLRAGFTLVELLVATLLTITLMAILWQLFGTYEHLFSRGQTAVEESQLARTLLEQMAEDLRSAISDSPVGAGAAGSVRRFGLFGTARAMQIDVLQFPPEIVAATSISESDLKASGAGGLPSDASGRKRPKQAPELRTVQYIFSSPDDSETDQREAIPGLIRRELDWEPDDDDGRRQGNDNAAKSSLEAGRPRAGKTASSARAGSPNDRSGRSVAGNAKSAKSKNRRVGAGIEPTSIDAEDIEIDSPTIARFAEVVDLQFRYFDGAGWSSQWNSLQRRSLPVAVEITLRTQPPGSSRALTGNAPSPEDLGPAKSPRAATSEALPTNAKSRSSDSKALPVPALEASPQGSPPKRPARKPAETVTRRAVVYLPGNALKPEDKPAGERFSLSKRWRQKRYVAPSASASAERVRPRPPRLRSGGTPAASAASDQWMRTGR